MLVFCALFIFYFNYYVGVLRPFFSTFINTLVFCAQFVLYLNYYVGVLRTFCFLLELLG